MAYTKSDLLEAFCRRNNYQETFQVFDENGVPTGETTPNTETKAQFLARLQKKWAKEEAIRQLKEEERRLVDEQITTDTDNVDL